MPLASDDGEAHRDDPLDDRLAFDLQIIVGGGCPEPPEQVIDELKQLLVFVLKWVDLPPTRLNLAREILAAGLKAIGVEPNGYGLGHAGSAAHA
jgi:hypothetical protein